MTTEQIFKLKTILVNKERHTLQTLQDSFEEGEELIVNSIEEGVLFHQVYDALNPFAEQKVFYLLPVLGVKYTGQVKAFMDLTASVNKLNQNYSEAKRDFNTDVEECTEKLFEELSHWYE